MEDFEAIYRRHVDAVFHYALRCTGRRETAEDLTVEAFQSLRRGTHQVHETQLPARLITLVKSRAVIGWQEAKPQPHGRAEELPGGIDIEKWLEQERSLQPAERACLLLRYVHGKDRAEVARRLGLTEDRVKKILETVLARLPKAGGDPVSGTAKSCPPPEQLLALSEEVLPADEAAEVRSHLEHCHLCQTLAWDLAQPDLSSLTHDGRERLETQILSSRKPFWQMGFAAQAGAALALVAFVVVGVRLIAPSRSSGTFWPSNVLELEKIPVQLPATPPGVETTEGSYIELLRVALEPYRAGDYTRAVRELHALGEKHPREAEPALYEGVSLLFLDQPADALRSLDRAKPLAGTALAYTVDWYRAIAMERNGDVDNARSVLRALCVQPSGHQQRACEMATRL